MSALCQKQTYAVQQKHPYSITSSAIASTPGGIVRLSAVAVLRLSTQSNLVGCSTGMSDFTRVGSGRESRRRGRCDTHCPALEGASEFHRVRIRAMRSDGQTSLLVGHWSSAERRWTQTHQASELGCLANGRYSGCGGDNCRNVSSVG